MLPLFPLTITDYFLLSYCPPPPIDDDQESKNDKNDNLVTQ